MLQSTFYLALLNSSHRSSLLFKLGFFSSGLYFLSLVVSMKRVNKHLDAINIFCENRSREKSRNWRQTLCRSKSMLFCVSIRSNLPEEDIFAPLSYLWNRPLGLINTGWVGVKIHYRQGSCHVVIRNASTGSRGYSKELGVPVVISTKPVPRSILTPRAENRKGQDRKVLITFLLASQGWVNPQSVSEALLNSHQQMK